MISRRLLPLQRCLAKPASPNIRSRSFHHVSGELITREPGNTITATRIIPVVIGDPGEAYVMVPAAIGQAIQTASIDEKPQGQHPIIDRIPLIFHHKTRHFAPAASLYPRLIIPQDLRGAVDGNITSPATLWLFGKTHSITLDETADEAEFVLESYKSHSQLEGVSENLKDR